MIKQSRQMVAIALFLLTATHVRLVACIWDSDTLADERRGRPKMAEVILGRSSAPLNPDPLRKRIGELRSARRENDPAWWNELAGAHLRLGEASEAIVLLEPVVKRFETNYGIHANLGTAYHLAGRYREAEKEIARDLEINPDAHFGLERYHLALLQYLIRDVEYQRRHVYVDEWSIPFVRDDSVFLSPPIDNQPLDSTIKDPVDTNLVAAPESTLATKQDTGAVRRLQQELAAAMAEADTPPQYRLQWNLAADVKFEEGIIYMATLNPRQPACMVLLGVASLKNRDLNLAAAAFERAIELGSPQAEFLRQRVDRIHQHILEARAHRMPSVLINLVILAVGVIIVLLLSLKLFRHGSRTIEKD